MDEIQAVSFVLCIRTCGDGQHNGDGAHAGGGGNACGFIKHGAGGGNSCGFDTGDCVGGSRELVHPVAGVPGVVCLVEDVVDAGNECGGILVIVLVAVIGGECKFCDAGANVLMGGRTCGEARIRHCWAG